MVHRLIVLSYMMVLPSFKAIHPFRGRRILNCAGLRIASFLITFIEISYLIRFLRHSLIDPKHLDH